MSEPHSTITPGRQPIAPATAPVAAMPSPTRHSGFWSFLRTFFVGTVGLAVLAVVGTLGGSAWLTANQRAEAQKPAPWADPSFTTTAVTTGGLLARWLDSDGDLSNGHSYIKGIYDLWKSSGPGASSSGAFSWASFAASPTAQAALPQLWQIEFNKDAAARNQAIALEAEKVANEVRKIKAELDAVHQRSLSTLTFE